MNYIFKINFFKIGCNNTKWFLQFMTLNKNKSLKPSTAVAWPFHMFWSQRSLLTTLWIPMHVMRRVDLLLNPKNFTWWFYCNNNSSLIFCTGWSYYLGIAATVLVFITAVLSVPADRSTTSRKVEEEMLEGKNLICVLWCHFRINKTRYLSDVVVTLTDTCSHVVTCMYVYTKLCYNSADSRMILNKEAKF